MMDAGYGERIEGEFRLGCARPGNALDATSSQRMSHRRYGKPVRLGYKSLGALLSAQCGACSFFFFGCAAALSVALGVFSTILSSSALPTFFQQLLPFIKRMDSQQSSTCSCSLPLSLSFFFLFVVSPFSSRTKITTGSTEDSTHSVSSILTLSCRVRVLQYPTKSGVSHETNV